MRNGKKILRDPKNRKGNSEEAIKEYGADALTIYSSKFTPMYHSVTKHKEMSLMKMICAGPEEKVGLERILRNVPAD